MEMTTRQHLPFFLNGKQLVGLGVEVGVLTGEFSNHILSAWHGKKLYSIDAWRHFKGLQDSTNGDPDAHLRTLSATFKSLYLHGERSCIIRELSVEASKLFQDNSLDFVFLDAAHDYVNVKNDLEAWYPKVKKGGIFCGHDYIEGMYQGTQFGVKSAVDEFAALKGHKVNVTSEAEYPTWWFEL
jgi:hypothetical protein